MRKNSFQSSALAIAAQSSGLRDRTRRTTRRIKPLGQRGLLLGALAFVTLTVPGGLHIALDAMSEAYLAVGVFVAGTLMLVLAAERGLETDLGDWLESHRSWQVPAAAVLGAFPGCGGAIIAVTQYTRGYLSFGSVVATLTATMGDAMFLLLAQEPDTALAVLGISMVAGIISGYAIDLVHRPDFLRPTVPARSQCAEEDGQTRSRPAWRRVASGIWLALMAPGIVLGVLGAFQLDVDVYAVDWLGLPAAHWLGVAGAALGLLMWTASDGGKSGFAGEATGKDALRTPFLRAVIANTNFVMTWVIFAFVGYELLISASGIDLARLFAVWAPVVPAVAILIGFVPGCGPQILVTTMYLGGTVPLSAQLGNAIANDGDALFPAIAVAPKAAIVATVYSAVPAVIVAYGWYLLWEHVA